MFGHSYMTDAQAKSRTIVRLSRLSAMAESTVEHVAGVYNNSAAFDKAGSEEHRRLVRDFEAGFIAGAAWALRYITTGS